MSKQGKGELLFSVTRKDLVLQTFRAGGKGGQNQNKRSTGVRIVHSASGAVGEARDERSQWANRKRALERLVRHPRWRVWHARRVAELLYADSVEARVARMMRPENLRIEVWRNGAWHLWPGGDAEGCADTGR